MRKWLALFILVVLITGLNVYAREKSTPPEYDAQELVNPLTRTVRLVFTQNLDRDIGPEDEGEELTLLNLRLLYPFQVNENWSVISRTTFRYFRLDDVPPGEETNGLSDTFLSLFLSPAKLPTKGLLWGIGPVLQIPTGTDEKLGTEKWGVGPAGAVVRQAGPWTGYLIASRIWSVGGTDNRPDVDITGLESAIVFTYCDKWNFFADTNTIYNNESDNWVVPLNIGVSRLLRIGRLPLLASGAGRYWIESPDSGPEGFGIRFSVTFQFPKGD